MPELVLRPYQTATVERVRAAFVAGKRAVLVVAPTGSGKTAVAVHIIGKTVAKKRAVVFVANRRVLVEQTSAKLDEFGLHDHGVVMAGHYRRRPSAMVQVASIQTLTRRERYPPADLVVVDEAHASVGRSYMALKARYPKAFFLGLSATPFRTDGAGLDRFFDAIVVTATIADLIEQGFLVPPRVYAPSAPNLAGVKIVGRDFDALGLEKAMNTRELVGDVVEHWVKHAAGRKTACFASTVAHSLSLVTRFGAAGVPSAHVDAETPARERARIFDDFANGGLLLISSVGVISEGWDMPCAEVGVMARPTLSLSLHIQQTGRLLRPFPGKTEALILDHAGNTVRHGFVTDELEYSLEGSDPEAQAAPAAKARVCKNCGTVMPLSATWCLCGYLLGSEDRIPKERAGSLEEVKSVPRAELPPFAARLAWWIEADARRAERGYKEGWTRWRYKEKFGVMPTVVAGSLVDTANLSADEQYSLWDEIEGQRASRGFKPGWSLYRYRLITGQWPPRGTKSRPPMLAAEGAS